MRVVAHSRSHRSARSLRRFIELVTGCSQEWLVGPGPYKSVDNCSTESLEQIRAAEEVRDSYLRDSSIGLAVELHQPGQDLVVPADRLSIIVVLLAVEQPRAPLPGDRPCEVIRKP